jgi:hypothetical protein
MMVSIGKIGRTSLNTPFAAQTATTRSQYSLLIPPKQPILEIKSDFAESHLYES